MILFHLTTYKLFIFMLYYNLLSKCFELSFSWKYRQRTEVLSLPKDWNQDEISGTAQL
jgi:hypothetical protein